ncbi:MAG: HAMP domain-containing protein [Spirochaetes bacterium]|nr:HAMP domain-containing protein [Spirochaetota bacterium]
MNHSKKATSRLKRKLTLYFLLISIVSISVSAEIIFEFSSGRLRDEIKKNFIAHIDSTLPRDTKSRINERELTGSIEKPIYDLRNRMILLLLVVFGSIIGAFLMFAKDIVAPMDGIVEATKKIADGDLTVTVPIMTNDEIGQIAKLINTMNVNLQDLIMQIRQEISRHRHKIEEASQKISLIAGDKAEEVLETKKMRLSDFKNIINLSDDLIKEMDNMLMDLSALETFVRMYKTYSINTGIEQKEIDDALELYQDIALYKEGE